MKKSKPTPDRSCPNRRCRHYKKVDKGNIIRHSFYNTSRGRRRRFKCTTCGKTFSATYGTPRYRLHR